MCSEFVTLAVSGTKNRPQNPVLDIHRNLPDETRNPNTSASVFDVEVNWMQLHCRLEVMAYGVARTLSSGR